MKKAVCISCTHHYQERAQYVEAVLRDAGYDCTYLTSDFHHIAKKHHRVDLPNSMQIPTRAYQKNISAQRIYSHIRFAKDAMAVVEQLQPDLLYVEVPPNSLCREAARYKKRHPNVKLIFDIFDMWPESFPNSRLKKLLMLPFRIWADFRNNGLPKADLVLTECGLFQNYLQTHLQDVKNHTLYLCRPDATTDTLPSLPRQEAIHLCYLGSINNIIDIPTISVLIRQIQALRPVVLHVIGDGETRDAFLSAVQETGAEVIFHGKVYDNAEKQCIFDMCSFGLNIMKDSVFIGLTMKSIDYFAAGLPILNSIPGDTWDLVEQCSIGVNVDRNNLRATAEKALSQEQSLLRQNTLSVFRRRFSFEAFRSVLQEAMEQANLIEK